MGNSLKMQCDDCGKVTLHSVRNTTPWLVNIEELRPFIGVEKILFRERLRVCDICGVSGYTLEMHSRDFRKIFDTLEAYVYSFERLVSNEFASSGELEKSILERAANYVFLLGIFLEKMRQRRPRKS